MSKKKISLRSIAVQFVLLWVIAHFAYALTGCATLTPERYERRVQTAQQWEKTHDRIYNKPRRIEVSGGCNTDAECAEIYGGEY